MRFLSVIVFSVFSFSAFSIDGDDIAGTWTYVGSGCRDTSLSSSSHEPATSENAKNIISVQFIFDANGAARMNAVTDDGGVQEESGTYESTGDNSFKIVDNGRDIMSMTLHGDTILIHGQGEDDKVCAKDKNFYYILVAVS